METTRVLTEIQKSLVRQYVGAFDVFKQLDDVVKAYQAHTYLEEFLRENELTHVTSDRTGVVDIEGNVHSLFEGE